MAQPEVQVRNDNIGRLEHIRSQTDGRVKILGTEYDLHKTGLGIALVHPEVEIPDNVRLGRLARIDRGTQFEAADDDEPIHTIHIGERTRVRGTHVGRGAKIGPHALVMAISVGAYSSVGEHSRVLDVVNVEDRVTIERSVRIGQFSRILRGATIGAFARIGQHVLVGESATIFRGAKIGDMRGEGSLGLARPVEVPANAIVEARSIA